MHPTKRKHEVCCMSVFVQQKVRAPMISSNWCLIFSGAHAAWMQTARRWKTPRWRSSSHNASRPSSKQRCAVDFEQTARWHLDMPRNHLRLEQDIANLAAELRRTWIPSQSTKSWQRRQLPRIYRLVQEGNFEWADVAAALNMASIMHETGRAWTGRMLSAKTAQVRIQLRARKRRQGQLWAGERSSNPATRRGLLAWFRVQLGLG